MGNKENLTEKLIVVEDVARTVEVELRESGRNLNIAVFNCGLDGIKCVGTFWGSGKPDLRKSFYIPWDEVPPLKSPEKRINRFRSVMFYDLLVENPRRDYFTKKRR